MLYRGVLNYFTSFTNSNNIISLVLLTALCQIDSNTIVVLNQHHIHNETCEHSNQKHIAP